MARQKKTANDRRVCRKPKPGSIGSEVRQGGRLKL